MMIDKAKDYAAQTWIRYTTGGGAFVAAVFEQLSVLEALVVTVAGLVISAIKEIKEEIQRVKRKPL